MHRSWKQGRAIICNDSFGPLSFVNLTHKFSGDQISLFRDIFDSEINDFWTEINGPIDFFVLLDDIGSSQNHFYLIDFNFERRKSHLLCESCRSSAFKSTFFQLEKDKKRQTSRAFWEISGSGGLNDLL